LLLELKLKVLFIVLFSGVFVASLIMTYIVRRIAVANGLLDVPNDRSSHNEPTPSGGGLSIVLTFFAGLVVLWIFDKGITDTIVLMMVAGAVVAAIGFLDDCYHVALYWRIITHVLSAFWVLWWMDEMPKLPYSELWQNESLVTAVIVVFFLVWLLNLFNFMDGIDGIAGSEAVFVSLGAALLMWQAGTDTLATISLLLAASTTGFLIVNWPPAKIFMGDVGSGFLGIMLGILVLASMLEDAVSFYSWLILLGVFVTDASITLLRRVFSGERWYRAHCNHAYQAAARIWGHRKVTIAVWVINICWLFPLSYASFKFPNIAMGVTVIALSPIAMYVIKLGAGKSLIRN